MESLMGGYYYVPPLPVSTGEALVFTGEGIAELTPEHREALRLRAAALAGRAIELTIVTPGRERTAPGSEGLQDHLTGLTNDVALVSHIAYEISAQQTADAVPFGLLSIDVDGFKQVNDRFGHATGDVVLRLIADVLRSSVRTDDLLTQHASRLHGDEFAVLCRLTPRQPASRALSAHERFEAVKQHLQHEFNARFAKALADRGRPGLSNAIRDTVPRLGLTVGGVLWEPGLSTSDLLQASDLAMLEEKRRRKRAYMQSLPVWRRLIAQLTKRLYAFAVDESLDRD